MALVLAGAGLGIYGVGAHVVPALTPQSCRVLVDGERDSMAPDQAANTATISAIGLREGLGERAVTIALATAIQESKLRNLDHGDRDSLGLFQQRPSQGWGTPEQVQDPVYASYVFYATLVDVPDYETRPLTEVAQDVQRSGHPEAYAPHEERAALLAQAFTGAAPEAVTCTLAPAEQAGDPAAVGDQLAREFDVTPEVDADRVSVTFASHELAWAGAHWAVAHAAGSGANAVSVGDRRWERGRTGASRTWQQVEGDVDPLRVTIDFR
ncbi:MAG: hypothetical protein Q4G43_08695 [Mobilicoccus sp.]|nr:hypothetical protein [Mobilicoccus sp.]